LVDNSINPSFPAKKMSKGDVFVPGTLPVGKGAGPWAQRLGQFGTASPETDWIRGTRRGVQQLPYGYHKAEPWPHLNSGGKITGLFWEWCGPNRFLGRALQS